MHLKPERSDVSVSAGQVDVLEHLQAMGSRKGMRSIRVWMRGPRWIPTSLELAEMRTSKRGKVRNLRTGALWEVNQISGEITAPYALPST